MRTRAVAARFNGKRGKVVRELPISGDATSTASRRYEVRLEPAPEFPHGAFITCEADNLLEVSSQGVLRGLAPERNEVVLMELYGLCRSVFVALKSDNSGAGVAGGAGSA